MKTVRVCFVCLGNICRSPTAEAVFARDVAKSGLSARFEIDSAGTGDWHAGQPAHADARKMAASRGVTITHRARVFTAADFARFDVVVAMDHSNRANLLRMAPDEATAAKVVLFRSFEADVEDDAEVPDPYYTGEFERVFDICEGASAALLAHLRERHAI